MDVDGTATSATATQSSNQEQENQVGASSGSIQSIHYSYTSQPRTYKNPLSSWVYTAPNISYSNLQLSTPPREAFRDIQVKVHVRKPERDAWTYLGRGLVSHEVMGHSSRVGMFCSLTAPPPVVFSCITKPCPFLCHHPELEIVQVLCVAN